MLLNARKKQRRVRSRTKQLQTKFIAKPKNGEYWKHYKGTVYKIISADSNWSGTETIRGSLITYECVDTRVHWTQPLERFLDNVTPKVKRFKKCRLDDE